MKEKQNKRCDSYTEIFSKYATNIGKTALVKMTFKPKTDSDSYTEIFSKYATNIGKTALVKMTFKPKTDSKPVERVSIISPSTSCFASPIITVPARIQ